MNTDEKMEMFIHHESRHMKYNARETDIKTEIHGGGGWFGVAVTASVASTALSYVEPG